MSDMIKKSLDMHAEHPGKIKVESTVILNNQEDLSLAYSPYVAEPCKEIYKDPSKVYDYTSKPNMVAVVSDGTAVLGLGNIGPYAALPVMEGKAVLFKTFAGVDAFPAKPVLLSSLRVPHRNRLLRPSRRRSVCAPARVDSYDRW